MEEVKKQSKLEVFKERFDSISYKGVVLNIPFMIFLALLALAYISNSNNGVALSREIEKKNKELEEIRWKFKDAEAQLILNLSEKKISDRALKMGIKPLDKPAFEIKTYTKEIDSNQEKQK